MMDDGLSVCLPDDPAGNAKLMFSILECLPKINRCTVLFLMDHLKKIMSYSDRNKMSSQSIAICFGPLFTCHSESENLHKPIEVFKFLLEIWPQRRTSASRSGSNDSMLSSKALTSKAQTIAKLDQSLPVISSHPISSIAQSIAITTSITSTASSATYSSHLPPISIPSSTSSMLPTASALTPGPSPTALTISEPPITCSSSTAFATVVTSAATDSDFEHQVSAGPPVPTTKKSVAFAQQNNNPNNSSGSGGSGGSGVSGSGGVSSTCGQSRALPPFPPNC